VDPAAAGAVVTTELCGHWEHDGPCRGRHHNAIAPADDGFALRVVFVARPEDVDEVETRIDAAWRGMNDATVIDAVPDVLRDGERPLAARPVRGSAAGD
jgi:hypothetical protein